MNIFAEQGYSGNQLKLLNEMRMYLRLLTVSDMTFADGQQIRPKVFWGVKEEEYQHSFQ